MNDESRQRRHPRFSGDAYEAVMAPGPFTIERADAVLAIYLPHGRISESPDGRVEPIEPPPDRAVAYHVRYPRVSGATYGHFAVYADGAVYAYRDRWVRVILEDVNLLP